MKSLFVPFLLALLLTSAMAQTATPLIFPPDSRVVRASGHVPESGMQIFTLPASSSATFKLMLTSKSGDGRFEILSPEGSLTGKSATDSHGVQVWKGKLQGTSDGYTVSVFSEHGIADFQLTVIKL